MPDVSLPPPPPQSALDWALDYMRRGWSVVPVRRGEKMPAIPWAKHQSAPAHEAIIRAWFDSDATMGLGLVQGRHVGTVVLDFDGELGLETLAKLEAKGLPQGIRQFTPRGGVHVMLAHPGQHVPTRKNVLPGMDIRGDGGFVVAHPSLGSNGRPYAWDADAHPDEAPLEDVPAWLVPIITGPVPGEATQADIIRAPSTGPLGLSIERVTDGREQYMRDTILAVCRDLRDTLGRLPTPEELIEAAWPQYSARVDFTRPGRGAGEFAAKARYTLARISAGLVKGFDAAPMPDKAPDGTAFDPETGEVIEPPKKPAPFIATPFQAGALAGLAPRQWVYGHFLIERFLSVLGAPGGTGKTAYSIGVNLSVATGKELLGERVHKAGPAWIYNLEDPQDELLRRVWAACLHHKIDPAELEGLLYLDSGRDRPLCVAERSQAGELLVTPIVPLMVAELKRRNIRLLTVDPFVKSHRLEENRNEQIDFAATLWNKVADEAGCAIQLVHHFRKGAEAGSADAFRGASALIDASRAAVSLAIMSEKEAGSFGVEPEDRRFHVRADNAKLNLAPPPANAVWLKLHNVELPNGDHVQAAARWEPPSPWADMPMALVVAILETIGAGRGDGVMFSPRKEAGDGWAGQVIMDEAGKTKEQAASILKGWEDGGALEKKEYRNEKRRREQEGYFVNTTKLAEMRGQIRAVGGSDE